jgi:hypothetical protein
MSNIAVEELLIKRQKLITERDRMVEKFYKEIIALEMAIETLSGRKVSDIASDYVYDDESPDYIKSSQEEI